MDKKDLWREQFRHVAEQDHPAVLEMIEQTQVVELPREQLLFSRGSRCENYLLVATGSIKTVIYSAQGEELLLYHVRQGESCVLTTTCLIAGDPYPAEGVTETPVTALVIPHGPFQHTLARSEAFRRFVFGNLGQRFSYILKKIEALNHSDLAGRLALVLLEQCDRDGYAHITHQQLAYETGSAREVISRRLKRFEQEGILQLQRGRIELSDRSRLEAMTGS
jgi:CRP/FNR family transcriptional regulator